MRLFTLLSIGVLGFAVTALSSRPSDAASIAIAPAQSIATASNVLKIADGCGRGRYRGPGGACHWYGRGPYPGGYWGPRRRCWRGPYGGLRCRRW
jgi:hypothetical protein